MSDQGDHQLNLLLRFSRRLALEREEATLRSAIVQFSLEVVAGDAAALVARGEEGELELVAHFGTPIQPAWPVIRRCVSEAISSRRPHLIHLEDRPDNRPERGRVAASPCVIGGRRGALVITRLTTERQLRQSSMPLLRMAAIMASEALRRAAAEARATTLDQHLDALAVTSNDGILLLDPNFEVTRANRPGAAALGVRGAALLGRRLQELEGVGKLVQALESSVKIARDLQLPGGRFQCLQRRHAQGLVVVFRPAEQRTTAGRAHTARYTFDDLLTQDDRVLRALDAARQTAQSDVSILITGESGTGKEVLAQAIHSASPRADEPFVAVNVAAIPSDLLESELFGYEPGAFTGAVTEGKPGSFELAGKGTLLLDEIGEMSPLLQTKLLRVLQERQVQRLGGTVPIKVQARVLATTNRDLQTEVEAGRFRLDLYHRLKVVSLRLPALRKRPGDIPLLAEHFLKAACEQIGRPRLELGPAVVDQLLHHPWEGNIRELSNLLLGVVSLLPEDARVIDELPVFLSRPDLTPVAAPARGGAPPLRRMSPEPTPPPESINSGMVSMVEVEKAVIQATLEQAGGNYSEAARILEISRTTLYNKVKKYGLEE